MKDRKPFNLEQPLIIWNFILAIFSIFGTIFTTLPILFTIDRFGFTYEMCSIDSEYANEWVFLFCLSKIPELLDTVFIVLRKRPLIFLHWYHHVATMWYCWIAWATRLENGGIFAWMNLAVHSFMYTYYACSMLKMSWTRYFRQSITTIQIFQMFFGVYFILYNIQFCNTHPFELYAGLIMYLSYAILFIKFYVENYYSGSSKPSGPKTSEPKTSESGTKIPVSNTTNGTNPTTTNGSKSNQKVNKDIKVE